MRSWILTGLGALLAVMLWRVAQGLPVVRERFTADQVNEMTEQLKKDAKAAGKEIPPAEYAFAILAKDDEAKVNEIFRNVRSK